MVKNNKCIISITCCCCVGFTIIHIDDVCVWAGGNRVNFNPDYCIVTVYLFLYPIVKKSLFISFRETNVTKVSLTLRVTVDLPEGYSIDSLGAVYTITIVDLYTYLIEGLSTSNGTR